MKSCFNGEFKITQYFGNDFLHNGIMYYKSMGVDGHDGIDIVPIDKKDKRIYSIHSGEIVYTGLHKIYGNRIGIWSKEKKILEYHNHLAEIDKNIKVGDNIDSHHYLGIMGCTGKCFGEHNHFAIAHTDEKGNRINRDNGYFGYINPVDFLN